MLNKYRFWSFFTLVVLFATVCLRAEASTITYYHNDLSGSPILASNQSGQILWRESYKPYGKKINNEILSTDNKIGFHGKPFDSDVGLSYYGARYYDPAVGRFMGIDPKEPDFNDLQSFNRYSFAANNPYKYVDPDGHSPIDVGFLVWDLGKLAAAIYTQVGIGAAAVDVGLSAVGVVSPVPAAGEALKIARAAEHSIEVAKTASAAEKALQGEKTYQVYVKQNLATGEVYTGRTSGFGLPLDNIARRDLNHHKNSEFGPADLLFSTGSKDAARGVEQINMWLMGGAKSMGGTSGNAINGISAKNPNLLRYLDAAKKEWKPQP
ncbi:RHS repeat domain-containing protein [Pseudomonas gingeri]